MRRRMLLAAAGVLAVTPAIRALAQGARRAPGANHTGVAFNADINVKVLEVVKLVMPGVTRIGILTNPDHPASGQWTNFLPTAAKRLGFQPSVLKAANAEDIEPAFIEARTTK